MSIARNGIRVCSWCRKSKPVAEFRHGGPLSHARYPRCKPCREIGKP